MNPYHIAQICENGHVIHDFFDEYLHDNENFCTSCGAKTLTHCTNCNYFIRGKSFKNDEYEEYECPSYCYNCGNPYPWTESALEAAQELLILEDILSKDELNYFNENMSAIIIDTPKSKIIATKLKMFMDKASSTVVSTLKDIIVEIGSETAKKIILGE